MSDDTKMFLDLEARGLVKLDGGNWTATEAGRRTLNELNKTALSLEAKGLIERVGMRHGQIVWGLTEAGRRTGRRRNMI
jgi:hypothetical protein